jgi:holliday junction DNA helicase RuvA
MIAAIRGRIDWMGADSVIIEVGGVSLRIFVPGNLVNSLGEVGSETKLYTHLYVREDQLTLYGFRSQDELTLFETLIGVAGVGPRAALNMLSVASAEDVHLAIVQSDVDFLKKVPGIGAKTASRIVLELKDKLVESKPTKIPAALTLGNPNAKSPVANVERKQVIEALMGLGYTSAEVQGALAALPAGQMLSVEEQVLAALRYLGQ